MDWRSCAFVLLALAPFVHGWSATTKGAAAATASHSRQSNAVSPYVELVICPFRDQPWSCARQQSARVLDMWDTELSSQWRKLKVEADRQLNATIERRGYSASEVLTKEKPSTILKKIEIGTKYMKEYLSQTMDGFLGREYDYLQSGKLQSEVNEEDDDTEQETDDADNENDENDEDGDVEGDDGDDGDENEKAEAEQANAETGNNELKDKFNTPNGEASSGVDEFIEIGEEAEKSEELRKKGGFGNKIKSKPGNTEQATLLVVKPLPVEHDDHKPSVSSGHGHGGHGGKPLKQKRKRRKKQKPVADVVDTVVVEHEPSGSLALDLLDELAGSDALAGNGGKKKKKHPTKYGRSNGVTRGKKKKKKKAIAKLVLIGTFLKAKIELLLKILGAHLQIKFFAIALIGLLINIARFWIDVKRGGAPQKVVYIEHAHHQHHYEEQGDDWGEQGSYWKRSLQTDRSVEEDSYQPQPQSQSTQDAHYMAYRNQWQ